MEYDNLLQQDKNRYVKYSLGVLLLNAGINFSFYGWTAIFFTYVAEYLNLPHYAGSIVNFAFFINYTLSILGGFLADSVFGQFKVLIYGCMCTVGGLLFLILGDLLRYQIRELQLSLSFIGIAFFILGNGITKPCIPSFMGDQFLDNQSQEGKALMSTYFSYYYFSIQAGAVGATVGIPICLSYLPPYQSFTILIAALILALMVFSAPTYYYYHKPIGTSTFANAVKIVWEGMTGERNELYEAHWLDKAKTKFTLNEVEDVKAALKVLVVFIPLIFFWAVFFQIYSLWVKQATAMDLRMGSFKIPPGVTTVLNGLLDLVLIPLFANVIYPLCEKCFRFTLLRRIGVGHVFTMAALIVSGFVHKAIIDAPTENSIPIYWIIPQYVLISIAEILLSISGVEFAYQEAPTSMKALISALFFSTTAIGNALIAVLQLINVSPWIQDFIFVGIIFFVMLFFIYIAMNYEYVHKQEGDTEIGNVNS